MLMFYIKWHDSMTLIEQDDFIGKWVKERIKIFSSMMQQVETEIPIASRPTGNYDSGSFTDLGKHKIGLN
jgi:hypothetical protein